MFEFMRRDKMVTLEPKRNYIVNDINVNEYDMRKVFTVFFVMTLFLISMKFTMFSTVIY